MRRLALSLVLVVASCTQESHLSLKTPERASAALVPVAQPSHIQLMPKPTASAFPSSRIHRPRIVNGQTDSGDPAVVELLYATTNGIATCTGELIGGHSVLTAGHCTDMSAGGELSGQGGPALNLCTTFAEFNTIFGGGNPSGCNLGVIAIFNNACTSNDQNLSCEQGLINSQDYIVVDQLVNPGYSSSAFAPSNDNDIGLAHLIGSTLASGSSEPTLLTFNRTNEGAACTDLGTLTFIGFGITSGNGQISGVKYKTTNDAKVLDSYHNYEGDPSGFVGGGTCTDQVSTNGGPTCSGDSGGPSMKNNVIYSVTSLGDQSCSTYSQDTRVDAHASWIDSTMNGWGDASNGTGTSGSGGSSGSTGTTTSSSGSSGGSSDECVDCTTAACANSDGCYSFQPDAGGNGYCLVTCTSNAQCPGNAPCDTANGVCVPTSGTCVGYVTGGSSGSTGTTAGSSGSSGSSGGTGDECVDCSTAACANSNGCYSFQPDAGGPGYCLVTCTSNAQCPGNAPCDTTYNVCVPTSGTCVGYLSGGSSGSSGSSGTTDPCTTCAGAAQTGACSTQATACGNDTACTTLANCLGGCSTSSCQSTCESTAGSAAVTELQAFDTCICSTACPTQCATQCGGGSGSSSGSTGVTTSAGGSSGSHTTTGTTGSGTTQPGTSTGSTGQTTGPGSTSGTTGGTTTQQGSTGGTTQQGSTGGTTQQGSGTTGGTTQQGSGTIGGSSGAGSSGNGSASGSGGGSSGGTGSVHLGLGGTSGSSTTPAAKAGGCSSAGLGDLAPAMFALLGLLRRRRQS